MSRGNAHVPWPPDKCSRETGSEQNHEQSLCSGLLFIKLDLLKNLPVQITLYHVAMRSNKNGLLLSFFPMLHAYMHMGVLQSFHR